MFEVASIRSAAQITPELIQAGKLHIGMKIDAGRVDIGYASLRDLVMQETIIVDSAEKNPTDN